MTIYDLPKFNTSKTGRLGSWVLIILVAATSGFLGASASNFYFAKYFAPLTPEGEIVRTETEKIIEKESVYLPQTTQEEAIIKAVNEVSEAVVSITITEYVEQYYFTPFEDVPLQKRTEKQEVGGGSGFIVSGDGMILTNKHVVLSDDADYTVLTNDGRTFPAKILARDPVQDLAVIKIESGEPFPIVKLGDSDVLQIGQTVIAIGNVLGEFQNSVSVGVISGLGRNIIATGGGLVETLEDVIQTDAAINQGNSGGPLLNLEGEVIGINSATVVGGENIGFAIPVNKAKKGVEQVKTLGKIVYPFLGVRYVMINEAIQEGNNLPVNYGAWVQKGASGEPAIFQNSAAEKAGLREGDIILEFNKEKITTENTLAKIIVKYDPGDRVVLKILRDKQEINIEVILDERSE
ncbi:MAG TPA: trypsin-like peptidase domain-containing protein [Candidatus Humimicrobiaceae bacterium]|nr:trypsin-like peptidase domain-containing protein [Candidatus Humimicrobiaceae bacterium]